MDRTTKLKVWAAIRVYRLGAWTARRKLLMRTNRKTVSRRLLSLSSLMLRCDFPRNGWVADLTAVIRGGPIPS